LKRQVSRISRARTRAIAELDCWLLRMKKPALSRDKAGFYLNDAA